MKYFTIKKINFSLLDVLSSNEIKKIYDLDKNSLNYISNIEINPLQKFYFDVSNIFEEEKIKHIFIKKILEDLNKNLENKDYLNYVLSMYYNIFSQIQHNLKFKNDNIIFLNKSFNIGKSNFFEVNETPTNFSDFFNKFNILEKKKLYNVNDIDFTFDDISNFYDKNINIKIVNLNNWKKELYSNKNDNLFLNTINLEQLYSETTNDDEKINFIKDLGLINNLEIIEKKKLQFFDKIVYNDVKNKKLSTQTIYILNIDNKYFSDKKIISLISKNINNILKELNNEKISNIFFQNLLDIGLKINIIDFNNFLIKNHSLSKFAPQIDNNYITNENFSILFYKLLDSSFLDIKEQSNKFLQFILDHNLSFQDLLGFYQNQLPEKTGHIIDTINLLFTKEELKNNKLVLYLLKLFNNQNENEIIKIIDVIPNSSSYLFSQIFDNAIKQKFSEDFLNKFLTLSLKNGFVNNCFGDRVKKIYTQVLKTKNNELIKNYNSLFKYYVSDLIVDDLFFWKNLELNTILNIDNIKINQKINQTNIKNILDSNILLLIKIEPSFYLNEEDVLSYEKKFINYAIENDHLQLIKYCKYSFHSLKNLEYCQTIINKIGFYDFLNIFRTQIKQDFFNKKIFLKNLDTESLQYLIDNNLLNNQMKIFFQKPDVFNNLETIIEKFLLKNELDKILINNKNIINNQKAKI